MTVKVLAIPLQERVEVPEVPRVIEVVESVQFYPDEGKVEFVSVTTPLKLLTDVTLIVELPVAPAKTETLDGPTMIVKSWTVYAIMTECES